MDHRIFVFRCGTEDFFGLTHDEQGANLPADACAGEWRFVRSVMFEGGLPPWGMDVAWQERGAAVQAGLNINGYFLSEAGALPEQFCTPAK